MVVESQQHLHLYKSYRCVWWACLNIRASKKKTRPRHRPPFLSTVAILIHQGKSFQNSHFQERQGVPARWGDPARGIPTAKPPTVRESHKPGPPLEPGPLAPCPFPKRCRRGRGVPAGRGGGGSRLEGG